MRPGVRSNPARDIGQTPSLFEPCLLRHGQASMLALVRNGERLATNFELRGTAETREAHLHGSAPRDSKAGPAKGSSGTLRRRKAILLVLFCTVLGAGAQFLLKMGSQGVDTSSILHIVWSIGTNIPLLSGLSLYGLSMVLFVHALRNEQLSLLYPLISLTYIWVTAVSILFLNESVSFGKIAGVIVIVAGVALLGRDPSTV